MRSQMNPYTNWIWLHPSAEALRITKFSSVSPTCLNITSHYSRETFSNKKKYIKGSQINVRWKERCVTITVSDSLRDRHLSTLFFLCGMRWRSEPEEGNSKREHSFIFISLRISLPFAWILNPIPLSLIQCSYSLWQRVGQGFFILSPRNHFLVKKTDGGKEIRKWCRRWQSTPTPTSCHLHQV